MYRLYLWLENWPREAALVAARLVVAWLLWQALQPGETLHDAAKELIKSVAFLAPYTNEILKWGACAVVGGIAAGLFTRPLCVGTAAYFARDWAAHLPLLALLTVLITNGAGRVSADYQFIRTPR